MKSHWFLNVRHTSAHALHAAVLVFRPLVLAFPVLWSPFCCFAQTSLDEVFQPTTPVETLSAAFATGGATTAHEYGGFVEITVSGFGQGGGTMVNDAFYFFASSPGNPISPQLSDHGSFIRLSVSSSSVATCFPGGQSLHSSLVFLDGVGSVTPGSIPAYNPEHTYRFVIDLGTASGRFTVGDEDCGFHDNTGVFTFSINGVELAPPNPDMDKDGVVDEDEPCLCLGTPPGQVVTAVGCSITQLCPCDAPVGRTMWSTHAEYLACVRNASAELLEEGALTKEQRRELLRQAQPSACGR